MKSDFDFSDEIFEKIFKEHKKILENVDVKNPKLLITFSGIAGSGKTTLARLIAEKHKGVLVSSDYHLRKIIKSIFPDGEEKFREDLLKAYFGWFLDNLEERGIKNKFLVFDSSIDRKYDLIKNLCDKFGFKLFIIKVECSIEEILERVHKRDFGEDLEHFNKNIERWIKENKEFNKTHKVDFVLNSEKGIKEIPLELTKKLESLLIS